ncbi:MAG: [protein-PII] uridylyltransferase [Hyphomicrobiaceae bacterium]|nr:[protein-PII] uridylyltransferase [Hyphomicrobiaceae bacterium]
MMDKPDSRQRPYFDRAAERRRLDALIQAKRSYEAARGEVLHRLKALVSDARDAARLDLERSGGRACAEGLSSFQDELIGLILDVVVAHGLTKEAATAASGMAVVATGGYGRGLLAPGSDIDLLFLLPAKAKPGADKAAELLLYVLWDLGFKVGHATRTVAQCLKLAMSDTTIGTALLDARRLQGPEALFADLVKRFREEVVRPSMRAFVDAKMAERDERHKRSGDARYRVEPNIKDGKGGLRDLHTLHWLSQVIHGEDVGAKTVEAGIFTEEEAATFRRSEDFLWSVRCFLHFLTGRPEERLTFDVQPQMAEWLGYKRHGGQRAVERFMKHYFLVAKDVGDLTTILCGALEIQQLKTAPGGLGSYLDPRSWRTRRDIRTKTDFRIDNGRMNIADPGVFERDPVNIIRLFAQAAKTDTFLHPNAIRLLRGSLKLINDQVRADPEANRIFLDLLTSDKNPAAYLRRMNESGVLSRFIPVFRRVVGMMQFNMYHHYTVDEHLIRTVDMLSAIEQGVAIDELPLSTKIFKTVKNRRVLYVAAFLHDIGKGRREDHSVVGARVARELCPRLGLTAAETDTVTWLIAEHLTMSNIAQSRDISDPRTIRDFADTVKSPERLKLLLLLTVADIRAVGPGTWNAWKGQLLRTLYYDTEPVVAGGHTQEVRKVRVGRAQAELAAQLAAEGWSEPEIVAVQARFYDDYWLRYDTAAHVAHARLVRQAAAEGSKLAVIHSTDAFKGMTELTILAPNHPRLLSLFAGACAATGANIVSAQISSTRDGLAVDSFLLQREFATDDDEARRARRIRQVIEQALKGEMRVKSTLQTKRPAEHRVEAFSVEPEVMVNNELSDHFTVIEVAGRDRPGLLYDLTSALSDLSMDISSAHITTFGEKAVDVFYVTDLVGKKIIAGPRQEALTVRMREILQPPARR